MIQYDPKLSKIIQNWQYQPAYMIMVDRIFAAMTEKPTSAEFRESLPTRRAQSSLAQFVIRRRGGRTRGRGFKWRGSRHDASSR